jgi:hypothetical protein
MALVDNAFYVDFGDGATTGYYAVAVWSNHTAVAGEIIRQATTPAAGSERCFVCTTAGATGAVEPTWTVTRGALNTSSVAVYQECSGIAALNGDVTNTPAWASATTWVLGQVIKDGTNSYQICTVAGAGITGSAPTFSATAGTVTNDNVARWTSLGAQSNFTGWQAPHARISAAGTTNWAQGGNNVFIASEHQETAAPTMTVSGASSAAKPVNFLCVAKSPVPPTAVTTGATWAATGAATVQGTTNGSTYWNGLTISTGGNLALNNAGVYQWMRFDNSTFVLTGTASLNGFTIGANPSYIEWNNCSVKLFNTSTFVRITGAFFVWRNSTAFAAGSPIPTVSLIQLHTSTAAVSMDGVDFTGLTNALVGTELSSPGPLILKNCKVPAGVPLAATPQLQPGNDEAHFVNCDSAATNYRNEKWAYQGTLTTSGGASNNVGDGVYHTNGATDGVTPVSWKMATTANCLWSYAFQSFPVTAWNTSAGSIGSQTVTAYGIAATATVPNNDQFWIDIEYMGTVGGPLTNLATGTKASILATGAAQTADTSVWSAPARQNTTAYVVGNAISVPDNPGRVFFCTTGGTSAGSEPGGYASAVDGGSVTDNTAVFRAGCRFSMALTFTPQIVGYLTVVAKAGLASTSFYFDPKVVLTA